MKPFIIPLIVILTIYSAYKFGRYELQSEIEQRAKNTNDIEVIIFGEKQL